MVAVTNSDSDGRDLILRITAGLPAPGRLRRPFVPTSLRVTARAFARPAPLR